MHRNLKGTAPYDSIHVCMVASTLPRDRTLSSVVRKTCRPFSTHTHTHTKVAAPSSEAALHLACRLFSLDFLFRSHHRALWLYTRHPTFLQATTDLKTCGANCRARRRRRRAAPAPARMIGKQSLECKLTRRSASRLHPVSTCPWDADRAPLLTSPARQNSNRNSRNSRIPQWRWLDKV